MATKAARARQMATAKKEIEKGATFKAVAAKLGVHADTVSTWAAKNGWERKVSSSVSGDENSGSSEENVSSLQAQRNELSKICNDPESFRKDNGRVALEYLREVLLDPETPQALRVDAAKYCCRIAGYEEDVKKGNDNKPLYELSLGELAAQIIDVTPVPPPALDAPSAYESRKGDTDDDNWLE
jgi:hypothetical protein